MKLEKQSILLVVLFLFPFVGQGQENGSKTVLTVGGEKVSKNEFRTIYLKNEQDSTISKKDLEDYLELFIDFKLKVKEAEAMGFDTTKSFKREFQKYRDQLAQPYFIDSAAKERLLREAYSRTKQEVHASHILLRLDENALPADTAKAYERVTSIKERIQDGAGFMEVGKKLAGKHSDVRASELGYFSAFRMVYPFETVAYNTEVGSIGGPVRTRFGYHLIKVHDKRPSKGRLRVAHVMKRAPKKASAKRKRNAEKKIRELHRKIVEEGADFHRMARQHSEDRRSARRGGRLSWFQSGEMVPAFSEAAFALDSNGAVSEPVRTRFGWHIIKRLDHKGVAEFDEMRSKLEQELKESDRFELVKDAVFQRLREEYDLKVKKRNLKRMAASLPDTAFDPKSWKKAEEKLAQKPLFSFADTSFPVAELADHIGHKISFPEGKKAKRAILEEELSPLIDKQIETYERARLREKHPRFRALLQEYRDGILLFELMEQKVWEKALEDTMGLKAFYEANKENYRWEERLDLSYFKCPDRASAETIRKMLQEGKSGKQVRDHIRSDDELHAKVDSGAFRRMDRDFIDSLEWKEGVSRIIPSKEGFIVAKVHQVLEPSIKEFDEARGIVSSDYQDKLEKQWVQKLREKYTVDVNKEVLYSIAEEGRKGR